VRFPLGSLRLHQRAGLGGDDGPPQGAGRLKVAVIADLDMLRPGLEFASRGRFRCAVEVGDADVLLVTPCSPGTLHGLRQQLPSFVDIVVVDRREACAPQLIAEMLDGGATTVVSDASTSVLVAHLDVIARRRRW
jgi:hypothetical protein